METRDDLIRKFRRLACMLFVIYLLCPLTGKDDIVLPMGIFSVMAIVMGFAQIFFFMNGHEGLLGEFGTDDFGKMVFMFIYGIIAFFVPLYIIYKSKSPKMGNYQRLSYLTLLPLLVFSVPFLLLLTDIQSKGTGVAGVWTLIIIVLYHILSYIALSRQGKRIDDCGNVAEKIASVVDIDAESLKEKNGDALSLQENTNSYEHNDENDSDNSFWWNRDVAGVNIKYVIAIITVLVAVCGYVLLRNKNSNTEIHLTPSSEKVDSVTEYDTNEDWDNQVDQCYNIVEKLNISPNTVGDLSFSTTVPEVVEFIDQYQDISVTPDIYTDNNDITYKKTVEGVLCQFTASYQNKVAYELPEEMDDEGNVYSGGLTWLEDEAPFVIGMSIKKENIEVVKVDDLADAMVKRVSSLGAEVKSTKYGTVVDVGRNRFITVFQEEDAISLYITSGLPKQNSINMLDKYALQ